MPDGSSAGAGVKKRGGLDDRAALNSASAAAIAAFDAAVAPSDFLCSAFPRGSVALSLACLDFRRVREPLAQSVAPTPSASVWYA